MSTGSAVAWNMPNRLNFLTVVPMFHCNGWCYPWTVPMLNGKTICLTTVTEVTILRKKGDRCPDALPPILRAEEFLQVCTDSDEIRMQDRDTPVVVLGVEVEGRGKEAAEDAREEKELKARLLVPHRLRLAVPSKLFEALVELLPRAHRGDGEVQQGLF